MAGYSGTPLARKLGIKDNFRVALLEMPAGVRAEIKDALDACKAASSELDFAMVFVRSAAELKKEFRTMAKNLAPAGMLWVSWPKKSSGVVTDLDENLVRDIGLESGLVDVKVCAVDEVWSGLKFVVRLKDREKQASAVKRRASGKP
jgi:hypothetical protein